MLHASWLYEGFWMVILIILINPFMSNPTYSQSNNSMEKDSLSKILDHARTAFVNVQTAKYYVRLHKSKVEGGSTIRNGNVFLSRDTVGNPLGWEIRFEADNGMIYCYTGQNVRILDPKSQRIILVDDLQEAAEMIRGNVIAEIFFNVLTDTAKWENIFTLSSNISFEKDQQVDEHICRVVRIEYPDTELFSHLFTHLFINPNNFFVYQKIDHATFNGVNLIDTLLFSEIETDEPLKPNAFILDKPNGYTEQRISKTMPKEKSLPIGSQAPEWSLLNQQGDRISSEKLKGKILLLDFWYSTCGPCLKSMPVIQRIHEKYKDQGVIVIGMNSREKKTSNAINFMKNYNYTYMLGLEADNVANAFFIDSYPTTYVIDAEGKVLYKEIGFDDSTEEKINNIINNALKNN